MDIVSYDIGCKINCGVEPSNHVGGSNNKFDFECNIMNISMLLIIRKATAYSVAYTEA